METFADQVGPFLSGQVAPLCEAVMSVVFGCICFVWIARAVRSWID